MNSKIAAILPFLTTSLIAQINIVTASATANQVNIGQTYTQNFDSLASSGSIVPWFDNSTLPGWYSTENSYGTSGAGALTSLGSTGMPERALGGSLASFGLQFINSTQESISGFSLSYTGEQWRRNANTPQVSDYIYVSYKIFSAGTGTLSAPEWIDVTNLTFTSPNLAGTGSTALNGNLPENSEFISGSIFGISFALGEELWIRWLIVGTDIPNDHTMGIDNLSVTFPTVPEPASSATLLALLALGLGAQRRRYRA